MPTTPLGLRFPASSDAPDVPQYVQQLATDVDAKLRVPVVSSIAARNSHGSPYAGKQMLVGGNLHVYDGGTWRFTLYGSGSGTTDTNGRYTFSHGGGQAPTTWGVTPGLQTTLAVTEVIHLLADSSTSSTLTVRAMRTDGTASLATSVITFNWWAKF